MPISFSIYASTIMKCHCRTIPEMGKYIHHAEIQAESNGLKYSHFDSQFETHSCSERTQLL